MVYVRDPEMEFRSVCGACFSGDHQAHVATDGDRRCTCLPCCSKARDAEIADRAANHPSAVVASAPMPDTFSPDPESNGKPATLEPFMNVLVGTPIAFGVERVGAQDPEGKTVPVVTLRIEHSTGSQVFSFPPDMASELAHRILRESTGLHIAGN